MRWLKNADRPDEKGQTNRNQQAYGAARSHDERTEEILAAAAEFFAPKERSFSLSARKTPVDRVAICSRCSAVDQAEEGVDCGKNWAKNRG
jgi:hypothetical protein